MATDRYDINISGVGVVLADAQDAYETLVQSLRTATPGYGVAAWQNAHLYSDNALVKPIIANGHFYKATPGGTSGGSAPNFPTDGTTVTDGVGALVWTDQGVIGTAPAGTLAHTSSAAEDAADVPARAAHRVGSSSSWTTAPARSWTPSRRRWPTTPPSCSTRAARCPTRFLPGISTARTSRASTGSARSRPRPASRLSRAPRTSSRRSPPN